MSRRPQDDLAMASQRCEITALLLSAFAAVSGACSGCGPGNGGECFAGNTNACSSDQTCLNGECVPTAYVCGTFECVPPSKCYSGSICCLPASFCNGACCQWGQLC